RLGETAGAVDEDVRGDLPAGRRDRPAVRIVVPRGVQQLLAEADVRPNARLVGDLARVLPDLLAAPERVLPVRVRRGRQRVRVRRDVTGETGVGVVAPDTADVVGPLEDDEVLDPGPALGVRRIATAGLPSFVP